MNQGSLLNKLVQLYNQLAMRAMELRHNIGKGWRERHHHKDITSPLHDYIGKLADKAAADDTPNPDRSNALAEGVAMPKARPGATASNKSAGLHEYFQNRKAASILSPELGNKLKESTWHHLHEAIRLGRTGDKKNAGMHVDLANHTLKEAVQYMRREDFADLLDQIEAKLQEALNELER